MSQPLLTAEEASALIQFLDRVQLIGHQERHAMNTLVARIAPLAQPPQPLAAPETPEVGDEVSGD
jgi:hypothetical protein